MSCDHGQSNEPDVLPTEAANFRHQKECYVRFCDKNKVVRCMKKNEKASIQDVKEKGILKTCSGKFLYQIGVNFIRFNESSHRKAKHS